MVQDSQSRFPKTRCGTTCVLMTGRGKGILSHPTTRRPLDGKVKGSQPRICSSPSCSRLRGPHPPLFHQAEPCHHQARPRAASPAPHTEPPCPSCGTFIHTQPSWWLLCPAISSHGRNHSIPKGPLAASLCPSLHTMQVGSMSSTWTQSVCAVPRERCTASGADQLQPRHWMAGNWLPRPHDERWHSSSLHRVITPHKWSHWKAQFRMNLLFILVS